MSFVTLAMFAIAAIEHASYNLALADNSGPARELPRAVHKTTPPLFQEWDFEKQVEAKLPPEFISHTLGTGAPTDWQIVTDPSAPSRTHVLLQPATCSHENCYQILTAENSRVNYVDLSVRIHSRLGTPSAGAGLVFNAQDGQNFYSVMVFPATNTLKIFKVLNGQTALLKETPVIPKDDGEWHFLRIQRNTIISQDFIEISFDNQLILSFSDSSLDAGQVGVATTGDGVFAFDNLRAMEMLANRPLSRPAAY
ncbi:MAG: hypothetical protein VST68_02940 [Nitrospirota bacterium]|nr:hypothetical protein [Nitrospirota bacterium]